MTASSARAAPSCPQAVCTFMSAPYSFAEGEISSARACRNSLLASSGALSLLNRP